MSPYLTNSCAFSVVPEFQVIPRDQTVLEGQDVRFECNASGVPRPDITWSFSGGKLPGHTIFHNNIFLHDVRNTPLYEGSYTCSATSSVGTVDYTAGLVIHGKLYWRIQDWRKIWRLPVPFNHNPLRPYIITIHDYKLPDTLYTGDNSFILANVAVFKTLGSDVSSR